MREIKDLIDELNATDETVTIEAKRGSAIDNVTYRQLSGADVLRASVELRALKKDDLLVAKGKGRATYYVPGSVFADELVHNEQENEKADNEVVVVHANDNKDHSAPPQDHSAPPQDHSAPPITEQIPDDIKAEINALGTRADRNKVKSIVLKLCNWKELRSVELAEILGRSEKYDLRTFITPLRAAGKIVYTIPDMVNHPDQAYKHQNRKY